MTDPELKKDLAAIRKLPWVAKVVEEDYEQILVITKKNKLKRSIRYGVSVTKTYASEGDTELKEPFVIALPAYKISLTYRAGLVNLSLVKQPTKTKLGRYMPYPTYDGSERNAYYQEWYDPCLGQYEDDYNDCDSFYERLMIMAQYLQVAEGETEDQSPSVYAYHLGLMPQKYVQVVNDPEHDDDDEYCCCDDCD